MNEQRHDERWSVDGIVQATDALTGAPLGRLGNLSRGGLMLMMAEAVAPDTLYQLSMELPDGYSRHILNLGVRASWTEPAHTSRQYWTGFRIIDISDEDQGWLDTWVQVRET